MTYIDSNPAGPTGHSGPVLIIDVNREPYYVGPLHPIQTYLRRVYGAKIEENAHLSGVCTVEIALRRMVPRRTTARGYGMSPAFALRYTIGGVLHEILDMDESEIREAINSNAIVGRHVAVSPPSPNFIL